MNQLYCGAAKECITPDPALLPNLYALMNRGFGGILDDLYLRVIALKSGGSAMLLICYELDKAPYPREWSDELAARFGISAESILYTAIHTHTAPLTDPRPYDGPNAKSKKSPAQQEAANRYEDAVHAALLRAADRAWASMVPARFGWADGESYINVNRNCEYPGQNPPISEGFNAEADVNRRLFLARFEALDGSPIAFLENYAVHNVTLFMNGMYGDRDAVSNDLGGHISAELEAEYPGSVAMWTSGAAGNVNPVMMDRCYYPDPVTGEYREHVLSADQTLPMTILLGRHMRDVRNVLAKIRCTKSDADLAFAEEMITCPGREGNYEVRAHGLRIGGLAICGFSGELYTSFGRQAEALSPYPETILINHDGSFLYNSGYILDDWALTGGAVGAAHSNMLPGAFGPALAEHMPVLYEKLRGETE